MRDTIDMAREAGIDAVQQWNSDTPAIDLLKAFEALVRADERALAAPVQEQKYTTTRNSWTGKATHKCNMCGKDDFRSEHAAKFHECQKSVPDAITGDDESPEYRSGWNECRETMLNQLATPPAAPVQEPPDDGFTQALIERDEYHAIADELAEMIAKITGEDIGEHTSANFPWRNALDAAENWLCHPPAAPYVASQLVQEPVAWMWEQKAAKSSSGIGGWDKIVLFCKPVDDPFVEKRNLAPLYTTPPAAPAQEPVATLIDHYGFTDGVVRFDGVENMEQLPIGTKFYISTPAAPVKEEIQRLRALVRAQQIAIEKLETASVQEPVAWMDGYRNIYSLEEKAAGCEDAVIPLVPAIQHWSDCAVHNEPAYPKGDCDCGGYTTSPNVATPLDETSSLAAPTVQEPVAITEQMAFAFHNAITDGAIGTDDLIDIMRGLEAAFAHITTPPASQRQWVGLTDEEFVDFVTSDEYGTAGLIAAVVAKLKGKNTAHPAPVQCWMCGDMDAEFMAYCKVPTCGMK